jgi:hypothetical protein
MPEVFDEASRLLVLNFMHELFRTKVKIDIDKFDAQQRRKEHKQSRIFHHIKEFVGFSSIRDRISSQKRRSDYKITRNGRSTSTNKK